MTNPNVHEGNKSVLESEKPRLVYQPPTLTLLEECDVAGGVGPGAENNNGSIGS